MTLVVDLLLSTHSTRVKSKRWPINAFVFVLDTSRTNPKTILQDNGVKLSNVEFTYQLGKALVMPAIKRRYEQHSNGLQIKVLNKMRRVLGIKEVMAHPDNDIPAQNGHASSVFKNLLVQTHTHTRDRD